MNVIVLLVAMVAFWFLYSLQESYKSVEKELREIRLKCMMPVESSRKAPLANMKDSVISGLGGLKNSI